MSEDFSVTDYEVRIVVNRFYTVLLDAPSELWHPNHPHIRTRCMYVSIWYLYKDILNEIINDIIQG